MEAAAALHCITYAKIRVSTDPYSPLYGQNRLCPYMGKYGSVKTPYSCIFYAVLVEMFENGLTISGSELKRNETKQQEFII